MNNNKLEQNSQGVAEATEEKSAKQTITRAADLTLIDGYGYVFRAFYALPPMTRKDLTPVNAVYGFTRMLALLLREGNVKRCLVVFDAKGKTFRSKIYPEYKAQRRETPPELMPQFQIVRQAAEAFSLPIVELAGFEADDLIASYTKQAREKGWNVEIYSSDKDLMQLVGSQVWLQDPVKARIIDEEAVHLRFGVAPGLVKDVMALAGDASDNIPGVPGIGVKTAAELINQFGNLEKLLAASEQVKQPKRREALQNNAEKARLSLKLVTLAEDAPRPISLDSLTKPQPEREKLSAFLREQDFISLLRELENSDNHKGSRGLRGLFPSIAPPSASPFASKPIVNKVITFKEEEEDSAALTSEPQVAVSKRVLNDGAELAEFCAQAREKGLCALAVASTSTNVIAAELVGVALSIEGYDAVYVPLAHKDKDQRPTRAQKQIPLALALGLLKELFEDRATLKVAHNLKQASALFKKHSIEVLSYDDILLLSATLDGGKYASGGSSGGSSGGASGGASGGHGLVALAARHLQYKAPLYKDLLGVGSKAINFANLPIEAACEYSTDIALTILRLHKILSRRLLPEKVKGIYETLERPLIPVVAAMELRGIRIDSSALQILSKDFSQRLSLLSKEIHELAGVEFAIASPKQLGEILFSRLNLGGAKKTASGQFSTNSSVLEKLADEGHAIATKVLEWRHLSKLRSTYTQALPLQVQEQTQRVHTSFSLSGAQTGRLASSEPNLQNIPIRDDEGRQIRRAFIAAEKHRLIALDYSQIELRLIASIASVEPMLESFARGLDIHSATAAEMFHKPIAEVSAKQRRYAKTVNFSLLYGISRFGLSRRLGLSDGEAQEMIDIYFARYPQLLKYRKETIEFCRANNYVETLFGRRIYIPAIAERNHHIRSHAERQAINAPVQGSAADIVKQAMLRLHRKFAKPPAQALANSTEPSPDGEGAGVYMLLQVHDEIILEAPLAIAETVALEAQKIMSAAANPQQLLPIPLEVNYRISKDWLAT